MPTVKKYIKIRDEEIPINIKSYKNAKSVKIFFKGDILIVTKPKKVAMKYLNLLLAENENEIYTKYHEIRTSGVTTIKQWETGEKIYYKGIELEIIREYQKDNIINIKIEIENKKLKIILPENIQKEEIKPNVDKAIKQLFKCNTEALIQEKLPYWSKVTGLKYNQVKVRDATTRYGSCIPTKRKLYFSSRLIMLPEERVDAIIVHELCHLVYRNHDKQFYELVEQYIPNYKKEVDKWLKLNGKMIMF